MPNFFITNPVPNAAVGITSDGTPTGQVTASAADILNQPTLSHSSLSQMLQDLNHHAAQMAQMHQASLNAQAASQSMFANGLTNTGLNPLNALDEESDTMDDLTNSSSTTMTKKAPLPANKPVTLTATGQLKPNTTTLATVKKPSRSTKSKPTTYAYNFNNW